MPKYSIVIPATRPHLLGEAIKSALAINHDDYEIVVSDNSVDGCKDLIAQVGQGRIRYVRPDSHLTVVPHWDFALSQAQGDWHLQLCDDDALTPNILQELDRAMAQMPDCQLFCWNYGVFRPDRQQFGFERYSGALSPYDSRDLLTDMFNTGTGLFRIKTKIPFFPRSACHSSVLDAIRRRQGHLFHPACPMVSGAAAMLAFTPRSVLIDLPMTVFGETMDSCGAVLKNSEAFDRTHAGVDILYAPIKHLHITPSAQADRSSEPKRQCRNSLMIMR